MADKTANAWVEIVPAMTPSAADSLWKEWLARNASEPSPQEVAVDCIHAEGGDLRRYRIKGVRPTSSYELGQALSSRCLVAESIVNGHLEHWNSEVLATLLISDVRRHLETGFDAAQRSTRCSCLEVLDLGIRDGDAAVQNAIAVCFVQDSCWWDPSRQAFVNSWPVALQAEIERQRLWPS